MPQVGASKYMVPAGWDDVPHLSEKVKREMLDATPLHMREARSKGIPTIGIGAIYPFAVSEITVEPFQIPPHYKRGFGLDDGYKRTACIWGALDKDTDTMFLTTEHYQAGATPQTNSQAILARGPWIPGVGDAAAVTRDGEQVIAIYRACGVDLELADKRDVEAGIYDVYNRLATGRLKVFTTCRNWLHEYSRYHRDERGRIAKVDDHLMDATRYLCRPNGLARMIAKPVENIIGSQHRVGDARIGY